MVLTATLHSDIVDIMEDKFSYKRTNQQLFEKKNRQCHPCAGRDSERKSWIPAFAGMTNTVPVTGTN
jgi:hypothetical protein